MAMSVAASRLRSFAVVGLVVALVSFASGPLVVWASPGAVGLSPAVARRDAPPGVKDFVYLKVRSEVAYRGGKLMLASTSDGTGSIITDDAFTITVSRQKRRAKTPPPRTFDFSRNCLGLQPLAPQEVTDLFQDGKGTYDVTVELRDRCGTAYSSAPYYLVGKAALGSRTLEKQLGQGVNPGNFGDPVNTAVGNFHGSSMDLAFPGHVFGLNWERTYNSAAADPGLLGLGWSSSLAASVLEVEGGAVRFTGVDGQIVELLPGSGGYVSPRPFDGSLSRGPDGLFTIEWQHGQVWRFDPEGRLASKRNWDGQEVLLSFDGDRLSAASGSFGARIDFDYDPDGRLTSATASDGRRVVYLYDGSGAMVGVTDPTGATTSYSYDDDGRMVTITDPDGRVLLQLGYDDQGRVARQETAGGERSRFAYDDGSATTTVTDETTGSSVMFRHDPDGQLVSMTDPFGADSLQDYDSAGNLVSGEGRGGRTVLQSFDERGSLTRREVGGASSQFEYDAQGRLLKVSDASGSAQHFEYLGASRVPSAVVGPQGGRTLLDVRGGQVAAVTDPDGVTTSFAYDPAGNVVAVSDGLGSTSRYAYDRAGRLTATTSPLGAIARTSHDAAGRVVEEVDPAGGITRFRYSHAGLLVETVDPTGASTRFTYDGAGRLSTSVDELGAVTTYTYNLAGDATTVTDSDGGITRYEYDQLGRLLSETTPTGGVTRHRYGPDGQRIATVDPSGGETSESFDERGRRATSTDPSGGITRFTYDNLDRLIGLTGPGGEVRTEYDTAGRVVAEVDPAGAVTRSRWTPAGRLAETEDPLGRVTRYAYDGAGRLAALVEPGGGVTRFEYDADGRRVAETSPAGLVARYAYDAAGRLVAETAPSGGVTRTEYSARGEPVTTISPGGSTRRFRYDAGRRLIAAIDANGGETGYAYSRAGRLTTRTDARGSVTRFGLDLAGRETERTDPLGRTARRSYDPAGRLVSTQSAAGETVEFAYDESDRLVSRTAGGSMIRYAYDGAGRRATMEDALGVTRYAHDAAGRLATVSGPDGARTTTSYDLAGQLTSLRYPSGRLITFGYDRDGRLVSLAEGAAPPSPARAAATLPETISFRLPERSAPIARLVQSTEPLRFTAQFEVDPDGRLTKETFPGESRTYGYLAGRLASLTETKAGKTTGVTELERDSEGRIVTQRAAGALARYTYDLEGQLTSVTGGTGGPVSMRYDAVGNRVEMATGQAVSQFSYDASGQLVERSRGGARTTYGYDSAGRVVREAAPGAVTEFGYDGFGRVENRRDLNGASGATFAFAYDGDDLLTGVERTSRNGRMTSESLDRFRWTHSGEVPQILTQTGAEGEAEFLYGYGRTAVATHRGAAVFERDVHGSTRVTPGTKPWARAAAYDAFGNPAKAVAEQRPGPAFGYRGELVIDDDIYLRARTYDPETSRFTTPDPLDGIPGQAVVANPYHYAANDPLNQEDPLGLRPRDVDFDRAFQPPGFAPPAVKPIILPKAPPAAGPLLGRLIGSVAGAVVVGIVVDIAFASSAGDPAGDLAAATVNHLFGQLVGQEAPSRTYDSQDDCESRAATDAAQTAAYGPQGVRDIPQPGPSNVKRIGRDRTIALAVYCINSRYGTAAAVSGEPPRVNLPGSFNDAPTYLQPKTQREAFDAEIKLLDGLIRRRIAVPGAIGVLYVVVEGPTRDVCASCGGVLRSFQAYVGDRLLTVVSSARELYINGQLVATSK